MSYGQVHKVVNGDKNYMVCYDKGIMGIWCYAKDSLPDGKWIFYYDAAMTQVEYIHHYKNGKRNGIFFYYREDGTIAQVIQHKNGFMNGECRYYHDNGQLSGKAFYYNQRSIGELIYYDSLGNVIRHDTYPIPEGVAYRKPFIDEREVNGNFVLSQRPSDNYTVISDTANGTRFFSLCNSRGNQYFTTYLTGDDKFYCFDIGYSSASTEKQCIKSSYPTFITENGLKLGMSREQLLKVKGTDFYVMTEEQVKYLFDKIGNDLNNQKDDVGYFLECDFEKDKIKRIKFGYNVVLPF